MIADSRDGNNSNNIDKRKTQNEFEIDPVWGKMYWYQKTPVRRKKNVFFLLVYNILWFNQFFYSVLISLLLLFLYHLVFTFSISIKIVFLRRKPYFRFNFSFRSIYCINNRRVFFLILLSGIFVIGIVWQKKEFFSLLYLVYFCGQSYLERKICFSLYKIVKKKNWMKPIILCCEIDASTIKRFPTTNECWCEMRIAIWSKQSFMRLVHRRYLVVFFFYRKRVIL